MSSRTIAAATATTALLTVGLSACGSSSSTPSASQVTAKAKKEATSAKSTSMSVSGSVQGQTVTLDASGTMDGKNQRQSQSASKLKSEEYVVGDTAYFKANRDFLLAQGMNESQTKTMADKWWSKGLGGKTDGASVDVKGMINQFFSSAEGKKLDSNSAQVKETSTRGQDTYTISDPKNPKGAKLVTTRGASPKIVEIQDYASSLTQNSKATYTFSKWNAVETFKAPAGAKSIDEAAKSSGSGSSSSSSPSASSSSPSASSSASSPSSN